MDDFLGRHFFFAGAGTKSEKQRADRFCGSNTQAGRGRVLR